MTKEFDDPVCSVCGAALEWVDCGRCDGDGLYDLYEEDPINYGPDDVGLCHECNGRGGWLECPIPETHEREEAEKWTSTNSRN